MQSQKEDHTDTPRRSVVAIVLAAGYGTRLERDLRGDTSGKYQHLLGLPKPLVPVGGKPLLNYWLEAFRQNQDRVKHCFVVTNAHHYPLFEQWAKDNDFPKDHLINDGTLTNETRLGALADVALVLKAKEELISEGHHGLLLVAGDTLFEKSFRLREVLQSFDGLEEEESLLLYYELSDHAEVAKRGILEVAEDGSGAPGRVMSFLEKPKPEETASNKACPPLYLYSAACLPHIQRYVEQEVGNNSGAGGEQEAQEERERRRQKVDAPGALVPALLPLMPLRACPLNTSRFDIGSLRDYILADAYFSSSSS
ncbi:Mannose-1-phosphate guanyltransferase-like [Balamuthia mandrillaris]